MSTFLDWVARLWAPWITENSLQTDVAGHARRLDKLEKQMTNAESYAARIDAATNELADDLKAVRDRLVAVESAAEGEKQAAVDAALAQLDGPIGRLEALGREDDAAAEPVQDAPVEQPADGAVPVEQQQLPDDAA